MKPALPVSSIQTSKALTVPVGHKALPVTTQSVYQTLASFQVMPAQYLMPYLGQYTRMDANGNVQLNMPLIEQIVASRESAVPALYGFISQTQNVLAICEALYTAQRLCESGVQGVGQLYGATQFWHNNPHPLVQIYLSGFYRKLNAPETFGPLMTMLMRNAMQPGPPVPGSFNPQEEVGGAILDLIANKAAEKMKLETSQKK